MSMCSLVVHEFDSPPMLAICYNFIIFTTNLHMSSLHNHQRVVEQMEQPVLDREEGFPVNKSYKKH